MARAQELLQVASRLSLIEQEPGENRRDDNDDGQEHPAPDDLRTDGWG
jgi:hypothetical protein